MFLPDLRRELRNERVESELRDRLGRAEANRHFMTVKGERGQVFHLLDAESGIESAHGVEARHGNRFPD
ncbi:MAG: hypothetical protein BWY66_00133 [bacterium ADurb.Bin374]|nr:MAG: hypothetical protein BWY66_00133 [bacterium ADurb.Bin374]